MLNFQGLLTKSNIVGAECSEFISSLWYCNYINLNDDRLYIIESCI